MTFVFRAFISYKREDEAFAMALEKALERFSPPRGLNMPEGRLKIFRDRQDIAGTEYNCAIDTYIQDSAKLIVLCSPRARTSTFVNDEIFSLR